MAAARGLVPSGGFNGRRYDPLINSMEWAAEEIFSNCERWRLAEACHRDHRIRLIGPVPRFESTHHNLFYWTTHCDALMRNLGGGFSRPRTWAKLGRSIDPE